MSAPLVFVPGWCLGRGPWQPTIDALGGTVADLPGYGEAPLIDDFHAAANALAESLAPGSILCGWSLGAMLALAAASRAPEKVGKLVLVAGTASFVQREGWPDAMAPGVLAEFTAAVAADVEAMLPRFVGGFNRGDARAKAVTRELLERADPRPTAVALATGLAWLRDVDLRPIAPAVAAPALILHGAADPLMPLPAAEALAALMPRARLEVFPASAHAPFVSDPTAFQARITAFLNDPTP
ncbi:MAG: carboxylesterase BioH (pimeloyl-CoA synthesis) [Rhodocyclaceae bacterium]|nr:carboxylesterase BioH (pimeloyl-CoA synthesis) [Rhodocyclaceae bacterium]